MNRLKLGFVTFGFLGLAPVAPGTAGTLGGVLIAWLLRDQEFYLVWVLAVCVVLYAIARQLGAWVEEYTGEKDPGLFVVDEVIGYLVTVAWLRGPSLLTLVVGFCVFRFFDIAKPPPVRRVETIPGGDGILLDDVVAGLYGLAVLAVARMLLGDSAMWNWEVGT